MKVNARGPVLAEADFPIQQQFGILEFGVPGHLQIGAVRNRGQHVVAETLSIKSHSPEAQIGTDLRLGKSAGSLHREVELAGNAKPRAFQLRELCQIKIRAPQRNLHSAGRQVISATSGNARLPERKVQVFEEDLASVEFQECACRIKRMTLN